MNIREISDQEQWDLFFEKQSEYSFLQSWEWGDFQKLHHTEVLKFGVFDDNKLCAIALVEKIKARRGSFLFIPYGPLVEQGYSYETIIQVLKAFLTKLARDQGFSFIRIAPALVDNPYNRAVFSKLGFRKAPIYMHAERMWVLDLDLPEETLLHQMRKTTRYLIKKADRDGVVIEKRVDKKAIDDFMTIYAKTAEREHFVAFSKQYIQSEFDAFNQTGNAIFFFGKVGTEYLASSLVIFTKHAAFYHQGASIHTKYPAPYRLQWEAIKEAKKRGCRQYNFWGILQEGRTPKNWGGLTLFKQGFGGKQIDYLPTQDLIVSPLYYATYCYELFLRWRRGV